jgi:hypothetical protein
MSWEDNSLEFDLNVDWRHITDRPENKEFKFISINNESGNIQRRLNKGWAIWDKEDAQHQDVWHPNKSAAKVSKDEGMVARIPVGQGKNGPTEQILMYKPMEQWLKQEGAMHKRNAADALATVDQAAAAKGEAGMEGIAGVKGTGMVEQESFMAPDPGSDVNQTNT